MEGIIQVAVGMVFIYSLLSILVTTMNTVITNFLKWRANHLKTAIVSLITDPEVQSQFLSHPLINMVKTEMVKPHEVSDPKEAETVAQAVRTSDVKSINYIDPKTFSQVLTSILAEKASLELYGPLLLAVDALPDSAPKQNMLDLVNRVQNTGASLPDLHGAIAALPAEQQANVLAALKPIENRNAAAQLAPSDGGRLLPVLEGLRKVNDDAFRSALKVIVGSAQSFDEAQKNLEDWFNQRMQQLSDVYTRNISYLTLVIGLIVALLLNADSLQIGLSFWNDPTLRQAVITTAQSAIPGIEASVAQSQSLAAQAAGTPGPESTETPGLSANAQAISASAQQVANSLSQLTTLNLPIGWEFTPITKTCYGQDKKPIDCATPQTEANPITVACYAPDNTPTDCNSQRNIWLLGPANNPENWFGMIIRKVLGILVTVIAIGQGAPFWFDLIRRLVSPASTAG